jgi:hypothetical protein
MTAYSSVANLLTDLQPPRGPQLQSPQVCFKNLLPSRVLVAQWICSDNYARLNSRLREPNLDGHITEKWLGSKNHLRHTSINE